jgi:hypothetical protein
VPVPVAPTPAAPTSNPPGLTPVLVGAALSVTSPEVEAVRVDNRVKDLDSAAHADIDVPDAANPGEAGHRHDDSAELALDRCCLPPGPRVTSWPMRVER